MFPFDFRLVSAPVLSLVHFLIALTCFLIVPSKSSAAFKSFRKYRKHEVNTHEHHHNVVTTTQELVFFYEPDSGVHQES